MTFVEGISWLFSVFIVLIVNLISFKFSNGHNSLQTNKYGLTIIFVTFPIMKDSSLIMNWPVNS